MTLSSLFPPFSFTKGLKLGIWSIWLSGFLLICFSFYATKLLPSVKVEIRKPSFLHPTNLAEKGSPSITIFSAPNPFNGSVGKRQALAVRSWLVLSPNINVVLFGNDPSLQSFASAFGSRVLVDSDIDFSFLNVPFFHSMVARAETSLSDISVLIHPETVLLPDFISAVNHVHELDHDWFLVASSKRGSFFPFFLDEAGRRWLRKDGKPISLRKLQEVLAQTWKWEYCKGRMLMAWNNRDVPLHMGVLPPFLYGKGLHNHWFINEVYHSNYRFVFDASWTISNLHVHDLDDYEPIQSSTFPECAKMAWEYNGNLHLAELYGLFSSREVNFSDFIKLVKCGKHFMFTNKDQNVVYSPEHLSSRSLWKGQVVSRRKNKIIACLAGFSTPAWTINYSIQSNTNASKPLHLPYNLETLLPILADQSKTVVLSVAGYSYKDMLMSWVCRLRHLKINNFLVCALDAETYEFSVLQGIPVFRDSFAPRNISFNDCHFGTKCFQKVTKTKSRLVLQILKLGYNVLLSDVDVYWFRNPIPLLQTFGPAVLAAQSDEYNLTVPINLPRRLNSGFYFAWSDSPTIAALERVVMHAMTTELSEQPSFYDTLCGLDGSNRVGDDRCWEPRTNLTIQFLDRNLFPNGAYQNLWQEKNVRATCAKKGCYVLHNNWISGRKKKLERQVHSRLWDYDVSSRMCLHRWQRTKAGA
ncbi:beta-arabinofuranosyltransferase RAY1 isoform X1 [Beta vulgaris subsp. vulgaris]|uniref:beta-arabinofuranosyltransferase RAY1 isoform X1 n=1 Tax=Beta vulgaris subsp. vulgaris TaxID=3555 RepID=UPI0020370591|nr:beta-arabinofuranosyltransferase RAY1 isoform X1 [Beta vulgaris subsp. vulgaris]